MAQAGKADIAFDFGCGAWDNDGIQNLSRGDEGTGNREQGTGMAAGAFQSLPLQGKVGRP